MKRPANRTTLALGLTVLALALPSAAWFAVGWREATHRARDLEEAPRRLAKEAALRLAERLWDRLETLRGNESKRPFYHYQNFYHDPRGAYEGVAVVPSPLSQGPIDPLIRTYFQLDASGRFTLPQLIEVDEAQQQADADVAGLQAIRKQLELQIPTCVAILSQQKQASAPQAQPQQRRVEVLDSTAWEQNVQANEVYSSLRNPSKVTQKEQQDLKKIRAGKGNVQIAVESLQWHTIVVNKVLSLVALRDVQSPQGRILQGFLISPDGVADVLKASPFPAQFHSGPPQTEADVAVRLDDNLWHVAVDARIDVADAHAQARAVRVSFLRVFLGGVAAASVAGLCVVGLVWQTERLARQRSQFAASAAHELRTPLAGLRLYSDMLAEGMGDPSRLKEYARRVADEAERLGRVVGNMLGFTRLERGTLAVHPEAGDLAAAVRECVARQQPALEALGAKLDVAIPEALPAVRFDRDAVAQILQNLLDNAEKHTRHATNRTIQVTLSGVGSQARSEAECRGPKGNATGVAHYERPPAHVEFSVADHGPGVPRRVRRRLFHPFQRGNETDAPAGVGLGLVLVKALVRAHGGTVSYDDAPGGGARFTVRLPA